VGYLPLRFKRLTDTSMMFRAVFWVILPCKMIVDRRFRGAYCLHHSSLIMEAVRTTETSVDNHFIRQRYVLPPSLIPDDGGGTHL
jgi:hypothetical protein